MNNIPPDWDFEIQALRDAAVDAGIRGAIAPSELGIELESAEELITRLKAGDASHDELAQRRSRRRRLSLFASSVAAVGVLVTGVLQPWGSPPVQAMMPAILDYEFAAANTIAVAKGEDPADAIQKLADAASSLPPQPALSGTQYIVTDNWYAEIDATQDASAEGESAALVPQIVERHLFPDGSLRLVERRGKPMSPDGRGLPKGGGWDVQPSTADEAEPPGSIEAGLASKLPTDSTALKTELLRLSGCQDTPPGTGRSFCLYRQIIALHRFYVVPPQLDAAIWQLLRDEPGFRLLGEVKDRVGREGIGISLIDLSNPEFRQVLIADPKSGRLLGSEEVLIAPVEGNPLKAPAIMSFTAILEAKYID